MRVGEWEARHEPALVQALGPPDPLCAQVRGLLGPPVAGPGWRAALVAEIDGAPVGAAVVFAPRWHRRRLWVSVEVAAPYRRRGVGSALLEAVRLRSRADGRPLRGRAFHPSPAARFAAARGFSVIQRSRTFRLESDPLGDGGLVADLAAPADVVAAAFRDFYLSSHRWDPPGPMSVDDVLASHVEESIRTIVVRSAAGEALAAACLYDDGELVLSGGPVDPADPRAVAATAALLDAAPRPVLVEADDSVPALLRSLERRGARLVDEVHVVAEA